VTSTTEVSDNTAESRYDLVVDGVLAGHADYERHGDRIVFTHTEVGEEFGGRGLGGVLAVALLDDARSKGLRVVPQCPFIARFIERHEEYADLVGTPSRP
jgi:predicted GNAT family acetyltransferase